MSKLPAIRQMDLMKVKPEYRDRLAQMADKVALVGELFKLLEKGVDYGKINGTKQYTLYKPGAEKLRNLFNHDIEYTLEDLCERGNGLFRYRVKCIGYNYVPDATGTTFIRMRQGEGLGSCSTEENKYKYRWIGGKQLPTEFQGLTGPEVAAKWKAENGENAVKWNPRGFYMFRVLTENPAEQENTVLKMAKKRAFVDFEILVTGISSIFLNGEELDKIPAGEGAGDHDEVEELVDVEESTGEIKPKEPPKQEAPSPVKVTDDTDQSIANFEQYQKEKSGPVLFPTEKKPQPIEEVALKCGIDSKPKLDKWVMANFKKKTYADLTANEKRDAVAKLREQAEL